MPLKNFLEVIQPRSRYSTYSPNIVLSTGEKMKVIQHEDQEIFQENEIFGHKKKPSPWSTVEVAILCNRSQFISGSSVKVFLIANGLDNI